MMMEVLAKEAEATRSMAAIDKQLVEVESTLWKDYILWTPVRRGPKTQKIRTEPKLILYHGIAHVALQRITGYA